MCTGLPPPRSRVSWMLSQENVISFSRTLGCSVFREPNVKALSLRACTAALQHSHSFHRVKEDICTSVASNGKRNKVNFCNAKASRYTEMAPNPGRKRNTDHVRAPASKDETLAKCLLSVKYTYILIMPRCVYYIYPLIFFNVFPYWFSFIYYILHPIIVY